MICRASRAYYGASPRRFGNCTISINGSRTRSGAPAIIGVSNMPGAMVHTRMPERDRSRAMGSVMPTTPALLAE